MSDDDITDDPGGPGTSEENEMTKADLSMCLIVRDDRLLERAVASVRPHVEEICIACTSREPEDQERARALADRFCIARHANDREGRIADFSVARSASFTLATRPHIAWMDSDDIVLNAGLFADVIEQQRGMERGTRILCPYEYEHDPDTGEPTVLQWRERIVPNDGRFHWSRPVHETLVASDGKNNDVRAARVVWKHMRTERLDVARNLRILREYAKAHGDDPWTMFNLGKDLAFAGEHREARDWLIKFTEATGDDEQRAAALLRLAECEIALHPTALDGATRWATRARALRPLYFEPRFTLLKIGMLRGIMAGDEHALHDVLNQGSLLIQMPPSDSLVIPSNPVERNWHVHEMMRTAAEILNDWNEALAATERALLARPKDPGLLLARKRYATAKKLAALEPAPKRDTDRAPPQHPNGLDMEPPFRARLATLAKLKQPFPVAAGELELLPSWEGGEAAPIAGVAPDAADSEADTLYDSAPPPATTASTSLTYGDYRRSASLLYECVEANIRQQINDAICSAASTTTGVECPALDVVIVCGPTLRPFNPDLFAKEGVGGSETAVIEMAKRLAARGCTVRVYCDCGREGTYGGVDYLDVRSSRPEGACDVLISWRSADYLKWLDAKVRLVWAHDTIVAGMNWPKALRADRIIALSQWHKDNLIKAHGLHPSHIWVSRNGIDPKRFEPESDYDPEKIVYSSSPDRGLALLLDMWPEIRRRVPHAELHVFYGFDGWQRSAEARGNEHERYLVANLQERMRTMPGVVSRGNVDQATLARELLSAGTWVLPGWFDETSCVGAMEARAAGCRIVASKRAALSETVGKWGELIEGDWLSDSYREDFVSAVVRATADESHFEHSRFEIEKAAWRELSWDGVADEWRAMFDTLLDESSIATMPEYQAVGT